MLFTFKQALAVSTVIALAGVFTGLIIRLIREKVGVNKVLQSFTLACRFLMVYPLIFPIVILRHKKAFAKFLVDCINKTIEGKLSSKKEKDLYKTIVQILNVQTILVIWLGFLKDTFVNYDEFIRGNIKIIKDILKEKEEGKNIKVCFMDYNAHEDFEPNTILESPQEIAHNKSSFFGLYVNYQLRTNIA